MLNVRSFVRYWLPIVIWWALIFAASSDAGSFHRSSRIIGPVVRWLFPQISPAGVDEVVLVVRKCAHLSEYAVLALLHWRALRKPRRRDPRPWSWRQARLALLLVVLYAASDEFHQTFVPSREGCVRDVLIDSCGALAGLLALWAVGRWRKWWPEKPVEILPPGIPDNFGSQN